MADYRIISADSHFTVPGELIQAFLPAAYRERALAPAGSATVPPSAGVYLQRSERLATVNAVVYSQHGPGFFGALARANPDFGVNLIHVADVGPDTCIRLKEKVDRGELLVIVGDRTPPADNGRVCRVEFLGAPAAFAQGPFILAALLECPVYLFFCLREPDGYRIHLEPFAERIVLPRAERARRAPHGRRR